METTDPMLIIALNCAIGRSEYAKQELKLLMRQEIEVLDLQQEMGIDWSRDINQEIYEVLRHHALPGRFVGVLISNDDIPDAGYHDTARRRLAFMRILGVVTLLLGYMPAILVCHAEWNERKGRFDLPHGAFYTLASYPLYSNGKEPRWR